jgi:hypothetical protein
MGAPTAADLEAWRREARRTLPDDPRGAERLVFARWRFLRRGHGRALGRRVLLNVQQEQEAGCPSGS